MHETSQQFGRGRHGRRSRAVVVCVALAVIGGTVGAQQASPPEGFEVAGWVLAPSFTSTVERDDNVFRQDPTDAEDIQSDTLTNWIGQLRAMLPFRNSRFDFDYEYSKRRYESLRFERDTEQVFATRLEMNFASRDRLVVSDRFTRGFSNILSLDPGQELTFEGRPFRLNRAEMVVSREVPDRPGYNVRLTRVDFNYDALDDPDDPLGWFDYRGYDGSLEFRQPIARSKWVLVYAGGRRFEHFNDPRSAGIGEVGVPYRKEQSDTFQIGMAGFTRPGQPFFVRLGYGSFRYDLIDAQPYRGLVVSALARLEIASRTRIQGELSRRPLSSSFATYYIINEVKVQLERDLARRVEIKLDLLVGRNRYGSAVDIGGCELVRDETTGEVLEYKIRKDRRRDIGATLDWEFHPRASLTFSASHNERGSNCDSSDYDANVGFFGLRFGWF